MWTPGARPGIRRHACSVWGIALGTFLLFSGPAGASAPWEIWHDLRSLAVLDASSQVLLRSSHCLNGCSSDKHAPGDPRYLRWANGEGVIFEERGPGALTRIWMTTGMTTSAPLPANVRIRFYFDGEIEPRLDLALPELFDGTRPPFQSPLVADRLSSSGGFISYVPMAFQHGCRVTLQGADDVRLWFQLTHHRLPATASVSTFTGAEDLSGWTALLSSRGLDPWPIGSSAAPSTSQLRLAPAAKAEIFSASSPGVINQLRLGLPPASWPHLRVTLRFDGEVTADLPAAELFAAHADDVLPTRSLLIGVDEQGGLYSWFPFPFATSASIELTNTGATALTLEATVRRHLEGPLPSSGRFAAVRTLADPLPSGADLIFLQLARPGRWVGLAGRLGAIGGTSRRYLEGDERIFLDGSRHPGLYGTGVEDLFGGGFYFDQGPFGRALHGMSDQGSNRRGEDVTAAYRLMLTDAVPFAGRIRAGLEAGPTGTEPMRAQLVAWLYLGDDAPLEVVDTLELGDASSRALHLYTTTAPGRLVAFESAFEGEPPQPVLATGLRRDANSSAEFQLNGGSCAGALRLRRRVDVGSGGQRVALSVEGQPSGARTFQAPNPDRRLLEEDVVLPNNPSLLSFVVAGQPVSAAPPALVELSYQLLCRSRWQVVFADGFESGDWSAWNLVLPRLVEGLHAASP